MCGIHGVVNFKEPVNRTLFRNFGDKLNHRGPDASGEWFGPNDKICLGHKRLKIIDLSDASSQPMRSSTGRYTLVFNGEIYNYKALRSELKLLGHEFKSSGDTEVLMTAFIEWQEHCLPKLDGMFSFLIYDQGDSFSSPSIFFARDRAGEKPFYYSQCDQQFSFASELKGVPKSGKICIKALNYYLALGYVPKELCLFEGVNKLAPGHYGYISLIDKQLHIKRYWKLPKNQSDADVTPEELSEKAGDLLEQSVKARLEADVPVGVMLSGGLDSSLIVAAAARVSSQPIQTYTMTLPGSNLDESKYARIVSDHYGTVHHELPINNPSLALLDDFSKFIDEPIADSSILPSYMVFGAASKNVSVVLGGDGGDEIFGGYNDYITSIADARRLRFVPKHLLEACAKLASHLKDGVSGRNRIYSLRDGAYKQMVWGTPYFNSVSRQRLLSSEVFGELRPLLDAPERFLSELFEEGDDPVDCMLRTHFGSIMPDDFLVKVDRSSMAHSLEVRTPFLDPAIIDFGYKEIPSHLKVANGNRRIIEKLLGKSWLPSRLNIDRKQGFSLPLDDALREEGEDKLMSRLQHLPEIFNKKYIGSLVDGLYKGRSNGARIYSLIVLSIAIENGS
jgi:asparagine synthase (glutamine-hydrolysing)